MKKDIDYSPKSLDKNVSNDELIIILVQEKDNSTWKKRIKNFFCFHKWIYWKYGPATKTHRVCSKCYKKQKNSAVISKGIDFWIEDTKIMLNPKPRKYNEFF